MSLPTQWWRDLSTRWKAITGITSVILSTAAASFGLGAATRIAIGEQLALPGRVQVVETRVDEVDVRVSDIEADVDMLQATAVLASRNQAVMDTLRSEVWEMGCILRAQVREQSAEWCLNFFRGDPR